MLESHKTTINGTEYEVTKLPYKIGKKLLVRLYKAAGPALAEAAERLPTDQFSKQGLDLKVSDLLPSFASLVRRLALELNEDDFDFLTDTLADYTKIGKGGDRWVPLKQEQEFHFSGKYGELLKWLGFALRVNYSDFLDFRDVLQKAIATARASQSQSTSIGSSIGLHQVRDTAAD